MRAEPNPYTMLVWRRAGRAVEAVSALRWPNGTRLC